MVNYEAAEATVELYCRALKMPTLRKGFRQILRDSQANGDSTVEFLGSCLAHEIEGRHQSAMAARMKQAKFPAVKTLDGFDFAAVPTLDKAKILALADGNFIRERENLVLLGNSGLGKTHLAIGLGVRAVQAGYRVRFVTVSALVQELIQAEREFRLPKLLKSWDKVDLLIADELGYVGLGPGGPLLFQLFAQRYEKSSLIITSKPGMRTGLRGRRCVRVLPEQADTHGRGRDDCHRRRPHRGTVRQHAEPGQGRGWGVASA